MDWCWTKIQSWVGYMFPSLFVVLERNVTCFVVKYVPSSFEVDYIIKKEDHIKTNQQLLIYTRLQRLGCTHQVTSKDEGKSFCNMLQLDGNYVVYRVYGPFYPRDQGPYLQVTTIHYPFFGHIGFHNLYVYIHILTWVVLILMSQFETKWDCHSFLNQ